MENLLQKIEKNLELCWFDSKKENKKIGKKSKISLKIVVCVSAGSDSVALLHLLKSLSKLHSLELFVLYFNHRLRQEAFEEQEFVELLAKKYKIPFYSKIAKNLNSSLTGIQKVAREWRISESRKILKKLGGDFIATGHQADDQVETLLLKLLRGVHISNLQGMSWSNPPFIRPLLNCRKSELQDYLRRNNFTWMEDSSNEEKKYLRNRVRLELIPLLEKLTRNGLQSRIYDLSNQSKNLRHWLNLSYDEWLISKKGNGRKNTDFLLRSELKEANMLLQEEILYSYIFERTGEAISYRKLQKILDLIHTKNESWEYHLSGNWELYHCSGEIKLKLK